MPLDRLLRRSATIRPARLSWSGRCTRALLLTALPCAIGCASVAPRGAHAADPAPESHRPVPQSAPEAPASSGATDAAALAKQLANPIAALISVPLQLNHDEDIGPGDGERWTLNVQPVVPITLNERWNLISRTILPIVSQDDIPSGEDESGLGDTFQSFFFSPKKPTSNGWILGAGPVFLIPTATDETLGSEKWGLGPTGVALKQEGPWTYGGLANHVWSFAGDDDRSEVNATFLQPFVAYTTPEAITLTLNAEATYDWHADELALPVNALASKVLALGNQRVSVGGGLRYWLEDSDASPEGLGFRFVFTFLFPR